MSLSPGEILNNRYRIVRLLGQGGFGAVYRAWDTNLDEPVAIKESIQTSLTSQKQFQLEAKLLFRLVHPNLPRVHDYFIIPDQGTYLVMDFIEGDDLGTLLERRGGLLPEGDVLPWIGQVVNALIYMHSQTPPVIHRDLKPSNIRITPDGKAMLVDLGIAKVFDPNDTTTIGAKAISPGYSPVEQYSGEGTDPRSDIYSLGATIYHLLTGLKLPESVKIAGGKATLCLPHQLNEKISKDIEQVILKAIEISASQRYQTMDEFWRDLQHSLLAPTRVSVRSDRRKLLPFRQVGPKLKLPWGWLGAAGALGVVIVLCLAGLMGLITGGGNETPSSTPTTEAVVLLPSDTTMPRRTNPPVTLSAATAVPPALTTEATLPPTTLSGDFTDEHGVEMKLIPAGEFEMGSESGGSDESPVHTVYLDAFYLDIYEVTNALYRRCVDAGVCDEPSSRKSYTRDSYYGNSTYDDYPVIYVDGEHSQAFCEWRGARLPTEAEWEKAARGGLEGKLYPWGDESPVCQKGANNGAKFDDDAGCNDTDTEPVGSYSANGYGLFDMAGNVWEWVWDWYADDFYDRSPTSNPRGPDSGTYRLLRGGSWILNPNNLRVANRDNNNPDLSNDFIGFRCSRPPGR